MVSPEEQTGINDASELLDRIVFQDLKRKSLFLLKLRWWILAIVIACVIFVFLLGTKFNISIILILLFLIIALNAFFHFWMNKVSFAGDDKRSSILKFIHLQFVVDYILWFTVIYLSGGIASPFVIIFILHIIFASVMLTTSTAYKLSAALCVGLALISLAGIEGWLPSILYFGPIVDVDSTRFPLSTILIWITLSSVFFLTVFLISNLIQPFRNMSREFLKLSEVFERGKNKFRNIVAMIEAIGSSRDFNKVLKIVTSELALGMGVMAISVKLLDETGKILRYASSYGLPDKFFKDKEIEVKKSLLNRRIIEGEPFVTGDITQREMFQFNEAMEEAEIKSVLFMPLTVDNKIIGILGAYCKKRDRFDERNIDYFKLASGIVAIVLENARSYESIEKLMADRSWFMMRVAHNLRAPLSAVISMIDVLRQKHLGAINPDQDEYLRRIDRRTRTMLSTVNELMTLSESRTDKLKYVKVFFDIYLIAGRIERTFIDNAKEKKIDFKIEVSSELTNIWGNIDLIEQLFENLVSNAIKYTPEKGKVLVSFEKEQNGMMKALVQDTGIGIPDDAIPNLFNEFFRAPNAKEIEEIGTGLGLAIVKEIVELHGGKIIVSSEVGQGTSFIVYLPIANRKEDNE